MKTNFTKKISLLGSTLFVLLMTFTANAQTCDNPTVFINDDVESYAEGEVVGQAGADHWAFWPGGSAGGHVSTDFASGGTKSIKLDGTIAGQDMLLLLGQFETGKYYTQWDMYIPSGAEGYCNFQHDMPTTSDTHLAFEVEFAEDAAVLLYDNPVWTTFPFDFPNDTWFPVTFLIDIDNDSTYMTVNENFVGAWEWSEAQQGPNDNSLNSINFWPSNENNLYYIDNILFQRCDEQVAIDELDFQRGLNLYPNPAHNQASIDYSFDEALNLSVRMTNQLGQTMYKRTLRNTQQGTLSIDLTAMASGIYFVHLSNGENNLTKKLFVE